MIECPVSCEADCGPDGPDAALGIRDLRDLPPGTHKTEYFRLGFTAELPQPSTCADALLAVLEIAKDARRRFLAGEKLPNPKIDIDLQRLAEIKAMKKRSQALSKTRLTKKGRSQPAHSLTGGRRRSF